MTDKSHSVLKVFILTTQSLLGHFSDYFTDLGVFYVNAVVGTVWGIGRGAG